MNEHLSPHIDRFDKSLYPQHASELNDIRETMAAQQREHEMLTEQNQSAFDQAKSELDDVIQSVKDECEVY